MIEKPYKLLLMDDNAEVSEVIAMTLEEAFDSEVLEVIRFTEGQKALEYMKNNPVHIIMTDIYMPGMYGDTFLRDCTQTGKNYRILVLSGDVSFLTTSNCFLDGARFYIKKPFEEEYLINAVRNVMYELDCWEEMLSFSRRSKSKGNVKESAE